MKLSALLLCLALSFSASLLSSCVTKGTLSMSRDHMAVAQQASDAIAKNVSGSAIEQTWLRLRVKPDVHRNSASKKDFLAEAGLRTTTYSYDITELINEAARANVYAAFADAGARTREVFTGDLEIYRSQLVLKGGRAEYTIQGRLTIFDDRGGSKGIWTGTTEVYRASPVSGNTLPRCVPEAIAEFMQQLVEKATAAPEVAQACEDFLASRKPVFAMPAHAAAIESLPAPSDSGNVYALLVGVGDYANDAIPSLKYAAGDARAVQRVLGEKGVPSANIQLLLNNEATLRAIRGGISSHLGQALEGDTVVVYFSGHGSADAETLAARNYHDGFEKFLLPYDADPAALVGSGLSMSDLKADLDNLASHRVVLIVDACYAGEATEVAGAKFFRPETGAHYKAVNLVDDYAVKFVPDEAAPAASGGKARAVVVMAASQANQVSREGDQWQGSLFTHYVVKGLEGESDRNNDGAVTVKELGSYVEEKVSRESRSKQTPVIFPEEAPFDITLTPR